MSKNLLQNNQSLQGISRIISNNESSIFQEQSKNDLFYKIKVNTPQGYIKQNNTLKKQQSKLYESKETMHKQPFTAQTTGFDINRQIYSEEQIREAFNTIDINKDGFLSFDDLSFFLKCMGQSHTKQEVEEMIKMVSNNDKVVLQDFRKIGKGLLIPVASMKLPDQQIKSKNERIKSMKQCDIYNLKPQKILQAQQKQLFSYELYKLEKQNKSLEREIKSEDKKDKRQDNFLVIRKALEIEQKRKEMMSLSIDNIQNIIYKLSHYHKDHLELKDIVSLLNISDIKARLIFFDKNNIRNSKQLILDAILFSRKSTLERFQEILLIYNKVESLSFGQWKDILVFMMGVQQKESIEKRLSNLLKQKKLSLNSLFDKYFILNFMNEEFSHFNW